jgi:hypothetical protein
VLVRLYLGVQCLKLLYIQIPVGRRVELDRGSVRQQKRRLAVRYYALAQYRAQCSERLAQALPRDSLGRLGPEQRGQRAARVWAPRLDCQVDQQRGNLLIGERERLAIQGDLWQTKQRKS